MVAWTEYKQMAKDRGSLALELFIVETTPLKGPSDIKENLPAHLAYQQQMEEQGSLVMAGPTSDSSGNEMLGAGLILYRAESMEAARILAENDPMHSSGTRSFTLKKWLVNEGSISLQVGLSTGSVKLS